MPATTTIATRRERHQTTREGLGARLAASETDPAVEIQINRNNDQK